MTAFPFPEAVRESLEQIRAHRASARRIGVRFVPSFLPVKAFEMIRIYYREVPDGLRVLRILHSKRAVRKILRDAKLSGDYLPRSSSLGT